MTPKEKILKNSIEFRGLIINEVTILERWIDVYIAYYFCTKQEKVNEMVELVLGNNRISLDGKRKLLDVILERQNPAIWKSYPNFHADMNTTMKERNFFAHNFVNFSDEGKARCDNEVGLIIYSHKTRTAWYDRKKIDEILTTIRRCISVIEILHTQPQ
ncbi:hypothetical protein [Flavobacterium sp. UBA6046]|jgi:hypothetical protein|uniref:hypothetical protein n=1 Tax=Flavobacterium sp. UBA6046 TaxID=1946552 RepID=UPI0025BC626C|nr:hypothetical protein [Flavobacterium sp. UBA6046]